ncbi:metallophosphoesterase family protein [Gorillibacterium sp. sgz5001074]|uniref:metallophosphoesterase family protein n=1 Tax=Gorillibacterium sp. sgz5001074 TaxID=3446695 RepID=UPI003F67C5A6
MNVRQFIIGIVSTVGAGVIALTLFVLVYTNLNPSVIHADTPAAKSAAEARPSSALPADSSEPLLSFFVISDLHISSGIPSLSDHLNRALLDIESFGSQAQALFMTGDLTDAGTPADYKELKRVLSGHTLPPIHANMGNHDYYNVWINNSGRWSQGTFPNGKTDDMARKAFTSFFGLEKPYHDVWINGYHFILLSQETYVQEKKEVGEGAWYSEEQLKWFAQKMAEKTNGKPVFVLVHQELPPPGRDGASQTILQADRVRSILKAYPNVFVFSGDTHEDLTSPTEHYIRKEAFHWFRNSSVGRVLDSASQYVRKDAAQGLFVEVYPGKVVLRGREFSDRTWIQQAYWSVPLK